MDFDFKKEYNDFINKERYMNIKETKYKYKINYDNATTSNSSEGYITVSTDSPWEINKMPPDKWATWDDNAGSYVKYKSEFFDKYMEKLEDEEQRINNLNEKLDDKKEKLAKREKDLKAREEAVAEKEEELAQTPDAKLRAAALKMAEAKDMLYKAKEEMAKLNADKTAFKEEVRDIRKQIDGDIKNLQLQLAKAETEMNEAYEERVAELEKEFKTKTTKATAEATAKVKSVQGEDERLKTLRHQLADKEAELAAREVAVLEKESILGSSIASGKLKHRQLEL